MSLVLILIVCLLLFGGFGYYGGWHSQYPTYYGGGIGLGTILVIVLIFLLLSGRL